MPKAIIDGKEDFYFSKEYIVTEATAVYDFGLNFEEQGAKVRFSALVGIDQNQDGKFDEAERLGAMAAMLEEAEKTGAKIMKSEDDVSGVAKHIKYCADFSQSNGLAKDDRIIYFETGQIIRYDEYQGDTRLLKFLDLQGIIVGEEVLRQAIRKGVDSNKPETAGLINIPTEYKDAYYQARNVIKYLKMLPFGSSIYAGAIVTLIDKLIDMRVIEFKDGEREGFLEWISETV